MMDERIRLVLSENAHLAVDLSSLSEDADLYRAGMSSLSTVNVMMALEEEFSVEFPDHLLQASTFQSVGSIRSALERLSPTRE
jgi:acyl carrier protein